MINRAITARMATPQPVNPPPEQTLGDKSARWYASNLGFFDPNYENKTITTGDAMKHAGKDTIFRDVHLFVERIRDVAAIKRDELVRQNLSTCLKGAALTWYTSELIPDQKQLLKLGRGVEEWEQKLVAQFKERPNIAMATIVRERYTIVDARNRREPREYAGVITCAAKSAELGTTGHIIMLIYNGLDLEFQRDLPTLLLTTPLEQFLQQLDDRKDIWWGLAQSARPVGRLATNLYYASRPYKSSYYNNPYQPSNEGQSRFNSYSGASVGKSLPYRPPYRKNPYRQAQDRSDMEQESARQIEAPKPKLMITAGGTSESDLPSRQDNKFNASGAGNLFRPKQASEEHERWSNWYRQPYGNWRQQNRPQASYFVEHEQHYEHHPGEQILDDVDQKDEEHKDATTEQSGEHGKSYDQIEYGYHVDTATTSCPRVIRCRNCAATFMSNNKLHIHIRNCRQAKDTTRADDRRHIKSSNTMVVKSMAQTDSSGGFAF